MKRVLVTFIGLALVSAPTSQGAGWLERLGWGRSKPDERAQSQAVLALSQEQVASGLKEALAKGVEHAVQTLGKEDGFLNDTQVRIPMPESLQAVEKALRTLRQDRLADEFVATMNHAAEKAVPEAAAVLGDSIQRMTIADAHAILTGTNNAATEYFRRTSETNLFARFYPIVQKATGEVGLTSAYKRLLNRARFASPFLSAETKDIDGYVTQKTLDGLFLKIEEEERRIRENPAARTTELLERVFSVVAQRHPIR
jgi:hypothetical protein